VKTQKNYQDYQSSQLNESHPIQYTNKQRLQTDEFKIKINTYNNNTTNIVKAKEAIIYCVEICLIFSNKIHVCR